MLVLFVPETQGARVLMALPFGGKSFKHLFSGLGSGLAARGHEVVFLNAFKPTYSPVKGIREVVPDALAEVYADDKFPNFFKMHGSGMITAWEQYRSFYVSGPRAILESEELDELLKEKFDLVVLGSFAYSLYFLPVVLKTPFIFITPLPYFPILTSPLGNPTIPALNPIYYVATSNKMTFAKTVANMLSHMFMVILMRRMYASYADGMVAERFGSGVFPPALEIERNASLVLLNSSPVINNHKPLLPNDIEVGGMHCRDPEPLPKELSDFLGDSEFVFFSLGSVAKPRDMPPDQKSAILAALGSLPFKVLLKWDTTDRTDISANILPSMWLPQQDILGNSHCRLFVSHGGLASLFESICHGVPLLLMPLALDQHFNTINAVSLGLAESLSWDELSPERLGSVITSALSAEHRAAARHRQRLLREQPVPPRDLAVHWVEHVIRHGGAPHLRSVGADLNFLQYYSLDVLAFLLAVLLLLLKLFVMMFMCCCRSVRGRKGSHVPPGHEMMSRLAMNSDRDRLRGKGEKLE